MHLWFTAGILSRHLVQIKHNTGSYDKHVHINNGQQDFMYVKGVACSDKLTENYPPYLQFQHLSILASIIWSLTCISLSLCHKWHFNRQIKNIYIYLKTHCTLSSQHQWLAIKVRNLLEHLATPESNSSLRSWS